MRSVASMAGLVIVALISGLLYKYYFSHGSQSAALAHPVQTISTVGVRNDLLVIAQAERLYQAEHSSYAPLEELISNGAGSVRSGRDGYTYELETSEEGFTVTARCPANAPPGCTNYSVDQTMEVRSMP